MTQRFRGWARGWRALFALALLATMLMLLAPGDKVLEAKVWVASWLPYAQALEASSLTDHSDKGVHFALFAVLGSLAARIWWGTGAWRVVLLWLVAFGAGTECLQAFIPGRGASVADFLADMLGLTLGAVLLGAMVLQRPLPGRAASTYGHGGKG